LSRQLFPKIVPPQAAQDYIAAIRWARSQFQVSAPLPNRRRNKIARLLVEVMVLSRAG
jgi:hypothetical protein